MARVMTLEGINPARLSEIRAQLMQPELSWWHRPLDGLAGPSCALLFAGVVGGVAGMLVARRRAS